VEDSEAILRVAEEIVGLLHQHEIETVVIGAVALAAYHYVRQTEDIDLGVNADLSSLRRAVDSLILDLDETRAVCRGYRLNGLEELIREARSETD